MFEASPLASSFKKRGKGGTQRRWARGSAAPWFWRMKFHECSYSGAVCRVEHCAPCPLDCVEIRSRLLRQDRALGARGTSSFCTSAPMCRRSHFCLEKGGNVHTNSSLGQFCIILEKKSFFKYVFSLEFNTSLFRSSFRNGVVQSW
jgi:hypothetical protein